MYYDLDFNILQYQIDMWDKTVIVPVFENGQLPPVCNALDEALEGELSRQISSLKRMPGFKELRHFYFMKEKGLPLILVGLGKETELTPDRLCAAIGAAYKEARKTAVEELCLTDSFSHIINMPIELLARRITLTFASLSYDFTEYSKKRQQERNQIKMIHYMIADHAADWQLGIERAQAIASGLCLARDLGHQPGNVATPAFLAETALKLGREYDLSVEILEKPDMEKLGMGCLLGVARGSNQPPKFIVMQYNGADASQKPYVFVGKGLTFDAGGISIKPAAKMDQMKYDMLGGAAVIGIMKSIGILKPSFNAVAIIPATENLLGGAAMKPGDILTAMNGLTVEVLNTDAEGRLILADALAYASSRFQPKLIFDFATLTGAIVIALGYEATGVFGDSSLIQKLNISAENCGDKIWQLPIYDAYREMMKSKIADLKNMGKERQAGSSAAAAFLENFVGKDIPWVHFDIAGTGWTEEDSDTVPAGPTGFGPNLIIDFLLENP
jgi:leucyl aminopeptidase